ncbi:MAG: BMP family ABC transporter substrate-binding protein [Erysipelotrichaceae bacterium]|nr:BMP family ABC transporter substrate-binding protein [Erysipelotrichaceae bacterium]
MKKLLTVLLVLILGFSIAGCSGNNGGESGNGGETPAEELTLDNVRVAIFCSSVRGDSGIQDMIADVGEEMIANGNTNCAVYEVGDTAADQAKLKSQLLDVLEVGYDIIISSGSTMCAILGDEGIANEYPDTKFCLFDTTFNFDDFPCENVYSASFKANEGSYLAGIVAMAMAENGVIGFVGGQEISSIEDFCYGYVEGAKSVNPDGKILITFTNDWYDNALAKQTTISEIEAGATVVFPACGPSQAGVYEGAYDKQTWAIGCDEDREILYKKDHPEWVPFLLTSEIKDVYAAAKRAIAKTLDGTLVYGKAESLGLDTGCVGLIENGNYANLPDNVKVLVEAAKQACLDGSLKITSAYGRTADQFNELRAWANNE